jgi:hypothetical protein
MIAAKEDNKLFEIISLYSEPNSSEILGLTSKPSEDDISETSEDCVFIVSDRDKLRYSNRSSRSSKYSEHCPDVQDNDSSDLVSYIGSLLMKKLTSLG